MRNPAVAELQEVMHRHLRGGRIVDPHHWEIDARYALAHYDDLLSHHF
jgi:hypothetical protein